MRRCPRCRGVCFYEPPTEPMERDGGTIRCLMCGEVIEYLPSPYREALVRDRSDRQSA